MALETSSEVGRFAGDHVPQLRPDFARRDVDAEAVVWSPIRPDPVVLDALTRVFLDVVDGVATVDELVADVSDVVGVAEDVARHQVRRRLGVLDTAGLLTASIGPEHFAWRHEPFLTPPNT